MTGSVPAPAARASRPRSCPNCGTPIAIAVAVCPKCHLADPLNTPIEGTSPSVAEDEAHLYGELAPGHVGRAFVGPASSWNWIGMPLSAAAFFGCWLVILVLPVAPVLRLALFAAMPIIAITAVFVVIPRWLKRRRAPRSG